MKEGLLFLKVLKKYCGINKVSTDMTPANLIKARTLSNLYHTFITGLVPINIREKLERQIDE